jgi:Txe/YoeB family toxin of Txe-Axe toxin-antitoxin module
MSFNDLSSSNISLDVKQEYGLSINENNFESLLTPKITLQIKDSRVSSTSNFLKFEMTLPDVHALVNQIDSFKQKPISLAKYGYNKKKTLTIALINSEQPHVTINLTDTSGSNLTNVLIKLSINNIRVIFDLLRDYKINFLNIVNNQNTSIQFKKLNDELLNIKQELINININNKKEIIKEDNNIINKKEIKEHFPQLFIVNYLLNDINNIHHIISKILQLSEDCDPSAFDVLSNLAKFSGISEEEYSQVINNHYRFLYLLISNLKSVTKKQLQENNFINSPELLNKNLNFKFQKEINFGSRLYEMTKGLIITLICHGIYNNQLQELTHGYEADAEINEIKLNQFIIKNIFSSFIYSLNIKENKQIILQDIQQDFLLVLQTDFLNKLKENYTRLVKDGGELEFKIELIDKILNNLLDNISSSNSIKLIGNLTDENIFLKNNKLSFPGIINNYSDIQKEVFNNLKNEDKIFEFDGIFTDNMQENVHKDQNMQNNLYNMQNVKNSDVKFFDQNVENLKKIDHFVNNPIQLSSNPLNISSNEGSLIGEKYQQEFTDEVCNKGNTDFQLSNFEDSLFFSPPAPSPSTEEVVLSNDKFKEFMENINNSLKEESKEKDELKIVDSFDFFQ